MIQIIIKNELRNGKREPPKERGWCVCVCVGGGGRREATCEKHDKRLGVQIALSVRHRAKARQGGWRSGAPKINSKRNYVKIYGPGTEKGITGFPWNE